VSEYTEILARTIAAKGLRHLDAPVRLASGAMSSDFIDGKEALADGADLEVACRAILAEAAALGVDFDAVGGMTMGADQFSHGIAILAKKKWFVVRKEPKGRGTNKRIEGTAVGPETRVLLVEDVVTLGGSVRDAYRHVRETGADVVAVVAVVDRGDAAEPFFRAENVPYRALVTYRDLGIEPVRDGLVTA
jgi:orotate phosphoribosyltransferase